MADEAFVDSEFRSSNRKRLLKGLFYEQTGADKTGVKYTLKDEDHLGYPSLSRLYLEMNDPTEYSFALAYLESWDHWLMLLECNWFKPYVERWRQELEVKIRSKALASIIREAKNASKDSFAANKFLIQGGWLPKAASKRGRPSKEDIQEAASKEIDLLKQVTDDFNRLEFKQ